MVDIRRHFLIMRTVRAVEQVAQRGCAISILE